MLKEMVLVLLPSVFLILVLLFLFKNYLKQQFEFAKVKSQQEIIYPLKLQAYERLTLFLERIKPQNLLLRVNYENISSQEFHGQLLAEISNELNHNIAQQIYIHPATWDAIILSVNNLKVELNRILSENKFSNSAKESARFILQNQDSKSLQTIDATLLLLKNDVQNNF